MKYSELEKELRKLKCSIVRQGANHVIWYSPVTGKTFRSAGTRQRRYQREH